MHIIIPRAIPPIEIYTGDTLKNKVMITETVSKAIHKISFIDFFSIPQME